jgi:hypothetical protein
MTFYCIKLWVSFMFGEASKLEVGLVRRHVAVLIQQVSCQILTELREATH